RSSLGWILRGRRDRPGRRAELPARLHGDAGGLSPGLMTPLSGTVLLTGASGGIGRAIARAVAPMATELVLTGRRTDVLDSLADELGARVIACDLAVREDVARLAEQS